MLQIDVIKEDTVFVLDTENEKNILRERREIECFKIINRGKLWYNCLNSEQLQELNKWYFDWLNVTETLVIPVAPKWLNNKLQGEEILI